MFFLYDVQIEVLVIEWGVRMRMGCVLKVLNKLWGKPWLLPLIWSIRLIHFWLAQIIRYGSRYLVCQDLSFSREHLGWLGLCVPAYGKRGRNAKELIHIT